MNKFKPGDKVQINGGVVWTVVRVQETSMTVTSDGTREYWTLLHDWQLVDDHFLMAGSDEYDEVMQAQAAMEGS